MAWERVYTINDFWDGPRLGIADVEGIPHIYRSPFDTAADAFAEYFLVAPIDRDLLDLVLEDWRIWIRWEQAYKRGEASKETHPALPKDRERYEEIKRLISNRLFVDADTGQKLKAEFRTVKVGWDGIVEVQWSKLSSEIPDGVPPTSAD